MGGKDELEKGRFSGIVSELKLLVEDPIKEAASHKVMKSLQSGLDSARQYYYYALESFKDRMLVRDVLKQRYDKSRQNILKSIKKQKQKISQQKLSKTFESLRGSFRVCLYL